MGGAQDMGSNIKAEKHFGSLSISDSLTTNSSSFVSTSSDLTDDASSSSSSFSTSSSSSGNLFELSDHMDKLPIKRGLSKFYNGKSQTFGSLADVKTLEDLAKKETVTSYNHRMKSCKSYAGNLNTKKFGPKSTTSPTVTLNRPISFCN